MGVVGQAGAWAFAVRGVPVVKCCNLFMLNQTPWMLENLSSKIVAGEAPGLHLKAEGGALP